MQDPSLIQQARNCVDMFYQSLGQPYVKNERHLKHTIPRCAIGVALARAVGDVITGEVLGKDRTTVIHYRKKHEDNMRYWDTYPDYFETATHIITMYMGELAKAQRIEAIDRKIEQLVKQKSLINSIQHV